MTSAIRPLACLNSGKVPMTPANFLDMAESPANKN